MRNTEARERVLDLGIGGAQSYLLNDGNNTLRVGADIHFDTLKTTRIFHLENQTLLDAKDNLPFSAESFERIQIFYPDRSLLESVCNKKTSGAVKSLWPDLKRILRIGGIVELFLDEYKGIFPFSTARWDDNGNRRYIWKPHVKAKGAATRHGFDVKVEQLDEKAIRSLENSSALIFPIYANQYLVSATKTS